MMIEELLHGMGSIQIASERVIKIARTVKGMRCVRISGPSDVDSGMKPATEAMANVVLTEKLAEWMVEVPGHGTGLNSPGRNEIGYQFIWVAKTISLARGVSELYDSNIKPIAPELGNSPELIKSIRLWRSWDELIGNP